MKKLLGILVLSLMWCNVGFAETKDSVNYYTKQNYKIIKHTNIGDGYLQIITLKKGGHVIICTVRFGPKMRYKGTKCIEP